MSTEGCPMTTEDLVLAKRASNGDEDAFSAIYQTNYAEVYYHVARLIGDRTEAEDVTQEVFLRAYQFMGTYSGAASLNRWLRKVATNLCIDRMRKRTVATVPWPTVVSKEGEEQDVEFPDRGPSPLDVAEIGEGEALILSAIAGLPEYYRKVVVLHDVMEHRGDEIASEASCPTGTVKSRLSRAHGRLKACLIANDPVIASAGA